MQHNFSSCTKKIILVFLLICFKNAEDYAPLFSPTSGEKGETYIQDIEHFEDSSDPIIDALKDKLVMVTTIRMKKVGSGESLESWSC